MNCDIKLMVVLNKLSHSLLNNLEKDLIKLNISGSEYSILAHLDKVEKDKVQKLGAVSRITSGTITHTINKLIKKEYVFKQQDSKDARIFWISISEKGRLKFQEIHQKHLTYLNYLLSDFTDDEKELFIEKIKYFGKKIERKVKNND